MTPLGPMGPMPYRALQVLYIYIYIRVATCHAVLCHKKTCHTKAARAVPCQIEGYMPQIEGYMPQIEGYMPKIEGYMPQNSG